MRILHWFRKDLRLDDNTALSEAARDGEVVPFYASDPDVLGRPDIAATRVRYVLDALADLGTRVAACGGKLALDHGPAADVVVRAARAASADAVYWNDEYEPSLRARDDAAERALGAAGIRVRRFHDRLLVPPGAVRTASGTPFVVYTPFRRACEALPLSRPHAEVTRFAAHALPTRPIATIAQLGFEPPRATPWPGGARPAHQRLRRFLGGTGARAGAGLATYDTLRDVPAAASGSHLSADLKFGAIGVRRVADAALEAARADPRLARSAERFLSQLRWRDFYAHVLFEFPHVEHGAFRREYDAIAWQGRDAQFDAWRDGLTGYPIVDAGMRELLATGWMHNRVRMIVASFLTKDLLIDWRRGERHFMNHLVDGDLANNNGGWQWAAGTGTDAAPYFRIFHPVLQGEKFDADGAYTKRWVPELSRLDARYLHAPWLAPPLALAEAGVTLGETYPFPIVQHGEQRERALSMYRAARTATV